MKKNKLIALLEAIEGNPDIYLWNGFVEDFMDIDPVIHKDILVKKSKDHVHKYIRLEYMRDVGRFDLTEEEETMLKTQSEDSWKQHYNKWEFPNQFVEQSEFKEWYDKKKTIYLINAKTRGKSTWDRMGDMYY